MKKLFTIDLKCPYCQHTFQYNILSFKARSECPNCEHRLIVRTKMSVAVISSIIGFILLAILNQYLNISQFGEFINLLYWIIGCLFYVAVSYKLLCRIRSVDKVYAVDMEDPTILERKKRQEENKKS